MCVAAIWMRLFYDVELTKEFLYFLNVIPNCIVMKYYMKLCSFILHFGYGFAYNHLEHHSCFPPKKKKKINNGILKFVTQFTIDNLFKVVSFQVTYNTLLRARSRYGSLDEVQQCLSVYQDMRRAGYDSIK